MLLGIRTDGSKRRGEGLGGALLLSLLDTREAHRGLPEELSLLSC